MRGLSNFHRLHRFLFQIITHSPFSYLPRCGPLRQEVPLIIVKLSKDFPRCFTSGQVRRKANTPYMGTFAEDYLCLSGILKCYGKLVIVGNGFFSVHFGEDDLKYPPVHFCSCILPLGIGSRCSPLHSISEVR